MENLKLDKRALAEVYSVLIMLEEVKFNKIPKEIVEGIRNNRDENYEFDLDSLEENMLPDTERILATIYTYYLANKDEKNIIFKMIELEKRKKYNIKYGNKEILKKDVNIKNVKEEKLEMVPVKNNFFSKFINNLKNWFKRFW